MTRRSRDYAYELYGLILRSRLRLPYPELTKPTRADIELLPGIPALWRAARRAADITQKKDGWYRCVPLEDGGAYLRWSGLFEFVVSRDGRSIYYHSLSGPPESLHVYLLGQVLSFALVRQGVEPIHGTAVVTPAGAIGFLGDSGYGKSTLGAAFLQAGYPMLTDDLLVTRTVGDKVLAYPGPPRIKLFPAPAKSLLGKRARGARMNPLTPKMVIALTDRYTQTPAPLVALYVLTYPPERRAQRKITLRRLSGRQAFLHLVRNTFNTTEVDAPRLARHFEIATELSTRVATKSLSFPMDLRLLPRIRAVILEDLQRTQEEERRDPGNSKRPATRKKRTGK